MYDSIFNKIYKNKRYLKLFENKSELDIQLEKRKKLFDKHFMEIKKFMDNNNNIIVASHSNNLVFYKSLGFLNSSVENNRNIDEQVEELAKDIYIKNNISLSEYRLQPQKIGEKNGSILQIFPYVIFVIDTKNLLSWKEATVYYKLLNSTATSKSIDAINKNNYGRYHNIQEIETILKDEFNRHEEALRYVYSLDDNKKNIENNSMLLNPLMIKRNTDALENNAITIAYNNPSKRLEYRLYTSQLINDENPRSIKDCTQMLLNNCRKIEASLSKDSTADMKRSVIKFSNKLDNSVINLSEANEQTLTAYDIMRNNSAKENLTIIENAYNIAKIYDESITLADKGEFNTPYKNSAGTNMNIHVYLPEVLSPYVLYWNTCQWTTLGNRNGFELLKNIVGTTGNNFSNERCFIGFYKKSNQPLADSYIWINGKFIDISTKAGLDGKGASASMASLRKYIYKTDLENNPTNELTFKGHQCVSYYPMEFEIFDLLSSKPKVTAMDVFEILVNYHICNEKQLHGMKEKKFNKFINDTLKQSTKFTSLIMEILQSASYEFVQMNCKATSTTDDFYFKYKCQYPAVFNGEVDITFKNNSVAEFHIV